MVGMTRAHIADPHIVSKISAGKEGDIRPCVGATYCLERIYEGNDALCIHNPATGREASMPHVIAGRAGRQATMWWSSARGRPARGGARSAPNAGTRWTLFEAASKLAARCASPSRVAAADAK